MSVFDFDDPGHAWGGRFLAETGQAPPAIIVSSTPDPSWESFCNEHDYDHRGMTDERWLEWQRWQVNLARKSD